MEYLGNVYCSELSEGSENPALRCLCGLEGCIFDGCVIE